MKSGNIDELMELFEALVDVGVSFFYEDEDVPHGEITTLVFNDDDTVEIELDETDKYTIEVKDFINNHSKEGMNYHCWENVRKFDELLEK